MSAARLSPAQGREGRSGPCPCGRRGAVVPFFAEELRRFSGVYSRSWCTNSTSARTVTIPAPASEIEIVRVGS